MGMVRLKKGDRKMVTVRLNMLRGCDVFVTVSGVTGGIAIIKDCQL